MVDFKWRNNTRKKMLFMLRAQKWGNIADNLQVLVYLNSFLEIVQLPRGQSSAYNWM